MTSPVLDVGLLAHFRGRSFIKELDFTPGEWGSLLRLAVELKHRTTSGFEQQHLRGRNIALLFEKTSTRTRCAFEVAAHQQGAHVTYLDPTGSQLGRKESARDTGRVLGRMYDGIEYRGSDHDVVEELASTAMVPVWNGLTDSWHPTQSLCDTFTMRECFHHVDRPLSFAFCGDARSNVGNSLLIGGAMCGMDVRIVAPRPRWNTTDVIASAEEIADHTGGRVQFTEDVAEGVRGVDFVYTDVWVSMGEPERLWEERVELLLPYQVNAKLMAATRNSDVRFMHCLPANHNQQTQVGRQVFARTGLAALEVTDEVFESSASIVFDQAANRMHTIKAVMVASLGR
jgi:ornithine carbamoyltransferase